MKKIILAVAIISVFSMVTAPLGIAHINSVGTNNDLQIDPVSSEIATSQIDNLSKIAIVNIYSTDTDIKQIVEDISPNEILAIDSSTLSEFSINEGATVKEALYNGIPLVISGDSTSLMTIKGMSLVMNENADATAVYCDPVTKVIYYLSVESENNAEEIATEWIQSKMNETSGLSADSYGDVVVSEGWRYCQDTTKLNVSTVYEKLGEGNGKKFYAVKYGLQSVPTTDYRTADMTISCDVKHLNSIQDLISYAPTTTSGTSSVSVSLSLSASDSGVSGGVSKSWGYSVQDVMVNDRSDLSTDHFETFHDIDEDKNIGTVTYMINPGMLVSVSAGSQYYSEDNYQITQRIPYNHTWVWDPYYSYPVFDMSLRVLLDA